jgi:hypothetical protein
LSIYIDYSGDFFIQTMHAQYYVYPMICIEAMDAIASSCIKGLMPITILLYSNSTCVPKIEIQKVL